MFRKYTLYLGLIVLAFSLFLGACSQRAGDTVNEATFTARDGRFEGPDTIAAGWIRLRLENEGPEFYHMQLVRLEEGKTVDDLVIALQENPVAPAWAQQHGGPNPPAPGAGAEAIVYLDAGNYALIDTVPDREGRPHFHSGMVKALTVNGGQKGVEPEADVTIDLLDFGFEMPEPLAAGEQTVRINNRGRQPHEIFLARLGEGETPESFLGSLAPGGAPAEWEALGGISVIEPDAHGYFTVDLQPGRYVFSCFAPDGTSGSPHFMLGMIEEIAIQ